MDFAWAPTWTDRLWSIKPGKNNCLPQALRFASQGLKGTAGSVEARYSGSDVEPQWYVWHIWSSGNEPKPLKKINQEYVPHVWSYAASVQCETDLASIGETWSNQTQFFGLRGPKTDCFTVITSILRPNCGTAIFHHNFLRTCTAKLRTLYGLPFPRVRNASILSRIWVRSAFWHWIEEILQLPEKLLIIQNPFDWSSFFQALVPTCAKSIQILPKRPFWCDRGWSRMASLALATASEALKGHPSRHPGSRQGVGGVQRRVSFIKIRFYLRPWPWTGWRTEHWAAL